MTDGPLIVQSDKTVLLEVDHELAGAARAAIAPFAELERAPEHVHTYRITPLALWNARAAGHDAEQVVDALVSYSRYAVPQPLLVDIVDTMARYGRLQLVKNPAHGLTLVLPAPVFRMTADLQSKRRLGLTATLIREDGREGDVFSLIGPKRYDAPWKDIEAQGWIAPAECVEVRVTMTDSERMMYATAEPEERYRICSTVHTKIAVVKSILAKHPDEQTLVIGAYLDQLDELGAELGAPVIQGSTRTSEREALFDAFRRGEVATLVVSKVANFSIDLPEAAVAVQVSGTFGSRQEEAQRLGRILRPKADGGGAIFYSVVARDSLDAEYAAHRQRFLAEQGYGYIIRDADDLLGPAI